MLFSLLDLGQTGKLPRLTYLKTRYKAAGVLPKFTIDRSFATLRSLLLYMSSCHPETFAIVTARLNDVWQADFAGYLDTPVTSNCCSPLAPIVCLNSFYRSTQLRQQHPRLLARRMDLQHPAPTQRGLQSTDHSGSRLAKVTTNTPSRSHRCLTAGIVYCITCLTAARASNRIRSAGPFGGLELCYRLPRFHEHMTLYIAVIGTSDQSCWLAEACKNPLCQRVSGGCLDVRMSVLRRIQP